MIEWRITQTNGTSDIYTDEDEYGRAISVSTDQVGVTVSSYVGARIVATRIIPWTAISLFQEIRD